jgi:hypothetical protein
MEYGGTEYDVIKLGEADRRLLEYIHRVGKYLDKSSQRFGGNFIIR